MNLYVLDVISKKSVLIFSGIRLILIIDGSCQEEKRATWINRRNENIENLIYPTFDGLKIRNHPSDKLKLMPILKNIKLVLTHLLGAEVITSLEEADYEIAKTARDEDAIGILANDSDYLIYQAGVPLLSINDLDIGELKTKCYDAGKLAESLALQVSQLPLLASLAGNDTISKDKLQNFHSRLVGAQNIKIVKALLPNLAQYINKKKILYKPLKSGRILTRNLPDFVFIQQLEYSIQEYFLNLPPVEKKETGLSDPNWKQIVVMFKTEFVASKMGSLYSIMTELSYDCSESLEDYRESKLIPPLAMLWESTRFRLYGILLKVVKYIFLNQKRKKGGNKNFDKKCKKLNDF